MSLSDKILKGQILLKDTDVKEFIKELKKELHDDLCNKGFITLTEECFNRDIIQKINKLAGDKLI